MSGIFGIVDFATSRIEPEEFRNIAESASYRAPGGIGYQFLGQAGLAHLALHSGPTGLEQPLLDARGQVCVVLDGRLDNRPELVVQLEPAKGSSTSDAALLLAAYFEWGVACTDHLLGDFAFAVWDVGRRRLLCAVDPLGIKPLHYAQVGSLVCFASDAVQVLQHPAVPGDYNEVEIAAYLGSQFEDPERSFFTAVRKLAPGQRLIIDKGTLHVEAYWFPDLREICYERDEDYAAHFLEIFQRAVANRLRGGGNFVGIAMSGGLDSTSVAAIAHRVPGPDARAFTFAFDRLSDCDERSYSRAMTTELGLKVESIEAERLWSLESRDSLPLSPDTPFMGWRTCYQEIFQQMSAQGSRVLLMGHGGDDLLRGSSLIYGERFWRGDLTALQEMLLYAYTRQRPILQTLYSQFARPYLPDSADHFIRLALGRRKNFFPSWIHPDFAQRSQLTKRQNGFRPRKILAGRAQQEAYDNLVTKPWYWRLANWHDRNAASFGIEVRHPFLDRQLFEYVLAIPGEQLLRLSSYKNLLRRSMTGILPEQIRLRDGKTRFISFLELGLRERGVEEILDLLQAPLSADLGIFNRKKLRTSYLEFLAGKTINLGALWYTISLEIWLRRCESLRRHNYRTLASQSRVVA